MDKKVKVTYDALKAASEAIVTDYIFKHSLEVPENLKAEIEAICESIIQTLLKKNADYQDAWQRYGMFTGLIRLNDKLLRTETLSDGRQALVAEEKIGDTLLDIVGYGLLLKLWMDGQSHYGPSPVETLIRSGIVQPPLPFPWTTDENTIRAIVNVDKSHDKRIYKDDLHWYTETDGKVYADVQIDVNVARMMTAQEFRWRTDDCGKLFIFETDLDIEWEDEK